MIKTNLFCGMAVLSLMCAAQGEEPAKTQDLDIAARKESVANLETHIAQREKRLGEWTREIIELDTRIEKNIDELVKMIAGLRDSQESGTKVSQIKKDAIEGLKRGLTLYQNKRKEVRELVRTGEASALGDLNKLDTRIIRRVDQIVDLTKSIPTQEDVKKYESSGASYWDGYYTENTRITEDWKQNRRDATQSKKQRADSTKALKQALERIDQRRRSLKDLLANRNPDEAEQQLFTTELGQLDAYEDHIKGQLRDLATTSGDGGGRAVGRNQAHEIEDLIADARKDLREDVARLFQNYDRFIKGRAYLDDLKQRLADQKAWLEKNEPAKTGTGTR